MKNFLIKSAALAALTVISAVSCTKEQNVDASVSQPELHFIIKTAENTPVKSFIENNLDGTYTPKWTKDDKLALFIGEITTSTTEPTAILSNKAETGTTATFDETVPTDLTEGSFLSFSPAGAFEKVYTDGTVGINLSKIQSPSSLTIDEACDVLVAKPCDFTAKNGTVAINDLYFKRIFSIVKVNLKGVAALNGEKVTSFTLSAPTTLTGLTAVDLSTASISQWYTENESVVAKYTTDTPVFGGKDGEENTVWLVVNPTTVTSGSTVTFSGETENYTFSKDVTLSKELTFPQSQMAVINLTIGKGNYTAKKTVTYTVTSTSAVSVSGDAPSGSSETYSSTYSTKCQLTGGNSMNLTLSGYQGMTVKGLTLSMKSNSGKGAGYLSVKAGSTTLGSIGSSSSGVKFNTASWYGDWSTSYVDVKPTLSNTAYTVQNGENLVIVIGATANSLYCQSFTIEYESDPSFDGGSTGGGSTGGGSTGGGSTGGGETGGGETGGGEGGTTKYYKKVTSDTDIVDGGKYLIVYDGKAANGCTTDVYLTVTDITVENDRIESNATIDSYAFTINSVQGGYTLKISDNYIGYNTSTKFSKSTTVPTSNKYYWTFTVQNNNSVLIKNVGTDTRFIGANGSTNFTQFRAYSTQNLTSKPQPTLYKLAN